MYDILMFLSLGGLFGVTGFLGARMWDDHKAKKATTAWTTTRDSHFEQGKKPHFYREGTKNDYHMEGYK